MFQILILVLLWASALGKLCRPLKLKVCLINAVFILTKKPSHEGFSINTNSYSVNDPYSSGGYLASIEFQHFSHTKSCNFYGD